MTGDQVPCGNGIHTSALPPQTVSHDAGAVQVLNTLLVTRCPCGAVEFEVTFTVVEGGHGVWHYSDGAPDTEHTP